MKLSKDLQIIIFGNVLKQLKADLYDEDNCAHIIKCFKLAHNHIMGEFISLDGIKTDTIICSYTNAVCMAVVANPSDHRYRKWFIDYTKCIDEIRLFKKPLRPY